MSLPVVAGLSVVPAKAGTHNLLAGVDHYAAKRHHGVWVPAFAGTTKL
jgi:hypothetical protein